MYSDSRQENKTPYLNNISHHSAILYQKIKLNKKTAKYLLYKKFSYICIVLLLATQ